RDSRLLFSAHEQRGLRFYDSKRLLLQGRLSPARRGNFGRENIYGSAAAFAAGHDEPARSDFRRHRHWEDEDLADDRRTTLRSRCAFPADGYQGRPERPRDAGNNQRRNY